MKTFYVTFGLGTLMRGYYQEFSALNQAIVTAFCNKHYRGLWCAVYGEKPTRSRPLQDRPEELFYQDARHV